MGSFVTNVFEIGNYTTQLLSVDSYSHTQYVPPPKSLLIATPVEGGEFPLLLFLHGLLMYNSFYSQLIQHVASHGFIVIAPQLYKETGPNINGGIYSVVAITNWLSKGLSEILPPNIIPNLDKLALGGHSFGGKTSFAVAVALRKLNITTELKFSALIGVDPIDGLDRGIQTSPKILTYVPHSFNFDMATLVIGSGLGDIKKHILFPPCSPKGVNHENFFNECNKPSWHFVAEDYGHTDMMDDDTKGVNGIISYCFCMNGESRKPMRKFVGGVMIAFLKAYIVGDNVDLLAIRDKNLSVPLKMKFDYIV